MKKMTFRERLILIRDEKRLSQQELADMLDVSRQTVSRWESGKSEPSSAQITKICAVFNLDANELFSLEGAAGEFLTPAETEKRKADKRRLTVVLSVVGVFIAIALAGFIATVYYAVKDASYDAGATVWIVQIPQNTPMVVLAVAVGIMIVALAALIAVILRKRK